MPACCLSCFFLGPCWIHKACSSLLCVCSKVFICPIACSHCAVAFDRFPFHAFNLAQINQPARNSAFAVALVVEGFFTWAVYLFEMGARAPALPISRSSDFGRSIHCSSGPSGGTCPCRAIEAHFSVTSNAHRVFRFWVFRRIPFRFFARLSVRLTPSLSLSGAFLFGHFILFLFWAIQSA